MPYIPKEARVRFDEAMPPTPSNAGELNYLMTQIARAYWRENGANYQAFNDILGAFDGAKLELYRREVAPYEDVKIQQNGDLE